MNSEPKDSKPILAYAAAIVGCFLIIGALAWVIGNRMEPPVIDPARKAERAKALAELQAAEAQALTQPGWIDKTKGIVRLPVDVAVEITLKKWQDPKAAKAELVQRVQKATAAPPAAPAKPSEFE